MLPSGCEPVKPARDRVRARVREQRRGEEGELEEAEADADHLDPAVTARADDREEKQRCGGDGDRGRDAVLAADAGDARELRDQGAADADEERADGDEGPGPAELLADQLRVPFPGCEPDPHRQLHHEVKDGDQEHLDEQEPIAPAGSGLAGRDDAARVGVGEHHHQTRADQRQRERQNEAEPAASRRGSGREIRGRGHRGPGPGRISDRRRSGRSPAGTGAPGGGVDSRVR